MIRKRVFLQILVILLCFYKQAHSVEYGLFLEDSIIIDHNNQETIEKTEVQLSLKNLEYGFRQDILKNSAYNQKHTIIIDNKVEKTEDLFEFVGMFISNYESSNNVKIKVKFTRDAELDKGSIVWRVTF